MLIILTKDLKFFRFKINLQEPSGLGTRKNNDKYLFSAHSHLSIAFEVNNLLIAISISISQCSLAFLMLLGSLN